MASTIYLVRHAESEHNVSKDFSHRDPSLTELGQSQASALAQSFPALSSVAVVLTSPLARAVQTTLGAFGSIIDKQFIGDSGIDAGARLILDPDLQERSDLPCDTGSDRELLEARFPSLDFSVLRDGWHAKTGPNTADDAAVKARAQAVRDKLLTLVEELAKESDTGKRDVVVVTHGVFMKFLAEDESIDLPKAGWKAYKVEKQANGQVTLHAV